MTYDPMGRLNGMTQEVNPMWNGDEFYTKTWVNGVTYGLGGELRTITVEPKLCTGGKAFPPRASEAAHGRSVTDIC